METAIPLRSPRRYTLRQVVLLFALGVTPFLSAQSFVNGDFEEGNTGWSGCNSELLNGALFGAPGASWVARVDGNLSTSPSDDRLLCQSISGFIIGNTYQIDLSATRFGYNNTPDPVSATLTMDEALSRTISRTGGYAMLHEQFVFMASRTTHTFRVVPDQQSSEAMLFDDISITPLTVMSFQLIAFNAEVSGTGVQLHWTTASERDNAYFTLQRSTDGVAFADVLRVDAVGNSPVPVTYVAMDPSPIEGLSYYRLQQTNVQGVATTFHVVPLQFQRQFTRPLTVYPNPSSGGAAWLCPRDVKEEVLVPLSITDLEGVLLYRELITLHPGVPVDLSTLVDLPPGSYAVYVPLAGGLESVRLLVL